MAIYLLRHADSAPTADLDEPEWPLSAQGRQQAAKLIPALTAIEVDVIYSSPYRRAIATVAPFANNAGCTINKDPRFAEKKLTDQWLENHLTEVRHSWANFSYRLPAGESNHQCQVRIVNAIEEIASVHAHKTILISSHGNAISLYLNHLDPSFGYDDWKKMRKPALYKLTNRDWKELDLSKVH